MTDIATGYKQGRAELEFHEQIARGDVTVIQQRRQQGWSPNMPTVQWGKRFALHTAAQHGQAACVAELLNAGADVNAVEDWWGHTALHRAASHGHLEVAKLLLRAGANPDIQTFYGYTALHMAKVKGHKKLVDVLDPVTKAKDKFYATPDSLNNNGGGTGIADAGEKTEKLTSKKKKREQVFVAV